MKYDIGLKKLLELASTLKEEHAFPKTILLILCFWKEKGDNALDLFLSQNPTYIKLIEQLEKKRFIIKYMPNYTNETVALFFSHLFVSEGTNSKDLLKEYNKLWAGKMGQGGTGNKYLLLDVEKNTNSFYEFIQRNPNMNINDMKKAVTSYFSTLKSDNDVYQYAVKSSKFLEKIDSYLPSKKIKSSITEVENSYYSDL